MAKPNLVPAEFLYDRLTEQFKPDRCTDIFDKIGVQEHNTDYISKVYTATFANPAVIENILSRGEEHVMLFCHHPRPPMPSLQEGYGMVPQELLDRMKAQQVSFFSFHIPLDVAGPYSPGNTLARAMGTNPYDTWYPQNGALLGALCQSGFETVDELEHRFAATVGHRVSRYSYGSNTLTDGKFAVMAGISRSTDAYRFLRENRINVLVTGVTAPTVEWSQAIHEAAREHHVTLLGGTHYSTEKFALMSLCPYFRNLGVEAEFIDETPDLAEL
ncbi:Nif3-like dinuclear metal center hexameric protein [Oscillibacter hominis]|uniref:GTP cyclohydrolase 1 type 2 homolog n=2 Tax=Oscillospiraceae TaxID=216572 RepID=A0A7G9B4M4_9FIRM|nr:MULTISPECIES: Nif3-like dinuclear metal center hexameric protein [Oscillospiraceae]MBU5625374.1 Nif3-like dinuclear metal center hexameric protein [Dysosmobacter acutus]QNL44505.1 Nif3-like dinuclear metal center hexameric protein [Oscillibacter hominis]